MVLSPMYQKEGKKTKVYREYAFFFFFLLHVYIQEI